MHPMGGLVKLFRTRAFQAEMLRTFLKAMLAGYAGDSKKIRIQEIPGSRFIEFNDGAWKVTDLYMVTSYSDFSCGTTIIHHDQEPVWMMQYSGSYPEDTIPCLKAALKTAYEELRFEGGRGPHTFRFEGLEYRNFPWEKSSFLHFSGFEVIQRLDAHNNQIELGRHDYHGGAMF